MSARSPQFEEMIDGFNESVKTISCILRNKILSLDSDIVEHVGGGSKVGGASYSIGTAYNMIALISPADDHCKLYIHHFDKVDTSPLKLEGSGKHSRHIKLHDITELPRADLKRILHDVTHIAKETAN